MGKWDAPSTPFSQRDRGGGAGHTTPVRNPMGNTTLVLDTIAFSYLTMVHVPTAPLETTPICCCWPPKTHPTNDRHARHRDDSTSGTHMPTHNPPLPCEKQRAGPQIKETRGGANRRSKKKKHPQPRSNLASPKGVRKTSTSISNDVSRLLRRKYSAPLGQTLS